MRSFRRVLAVAFAVVAGCTCSLVFAAPARAGCLPARTTVRKGETLDVLLARWGLARSQAFEWGRRVAAREPAAALRPGDRVEGCIAHTVHGTRLVRIEILHGQRRGRLVLGTGEPMVRHPQRRAVVDVAAPAEGAQARTDVVAPLLPQGTPQHLSFTVANSLADSLVMHHVSPLLARAITDWLDRDQRLPSPLPPGAIVSALFFGNPDTSDAQLAQLTIYAAGHEHRLFRFTDAHGRSLLVDAEGQGVMPLPLVEPVPDARLTSGWGWRTNPVLHRPEFHKGVDFAAPMGTPIRAVADGRVDFVGWHGYYGRMVEVRHAPDVRTRYGHMARYARGLHDGEFVRAGQVIGYVGSSGLSTGPHLYLELWESGKRIDPLRIETQAADAQADIEANPVLLRREVITPVRLDGSELARFHAFRSALHGVLAASVDDAPVAAALVPTP